MSMRWVIIPDIQSPMNDKRATQAIIDFIRRVKPDGLLCVGDEIDLPSVSRWESGTATEFSRSLKRDVEVTNQIMTAFRAVLGRSKPFHISRSNHGDRLKNYVIRKAPALHEYVNDDEMLDIPRLVGYDKLGITYHRKPFEFTPGWVLCHGDEGNISPLAGRTATNLAVNKFGKSVVCGHTHRLGQSTHTTSLDGRVTGQLTGLEVGNVMDLRQAHYMRAHSANWQQGCGFVEADGKRTAALPLPIVDGKVVMP